MMKPSDIILLTNRFGPSAPARPLARPGGKAHQWIRKVLATHFSQTASERIRIQYGGSVQTRERQELLSKPDIDGRWSVARASTRALYGDHQNACLE